MKWTEDRPTRPYVPPADNPVQLGPPLASWSSTADDGAALEAFRWGSALGAAFVLEVRRYGRPLAMLLPGERHGPAGPLMPWEPGGELVTEPRWETDAAGNVKRGAPELPSVAELQSAADELLPPGTVMLLGVLANGPGAVYASSEPWRALRIVQMQSNNERARGGRREGRPT